MNCWENNLLIREIHNDSIFLVATDTCAANCLCMFGFETSIPDLGYDTVYLSLGYLCWLNEYHYQHYLDTVIYRDIVSVVKLDDDDQLYLYPNPIHEPWSLNIISSEEAIKSISLYQMSGRLVLKEEYQDNCSTKILILSMISSGIYFVKVETNTGITLRKLLKI